MTEKSATPTIREALLELSGGAPSIAPRDVAVHVAAKGTDWRRLLPEVRAQAKRLEAEGLMVFLRKGKVVKSEGLKGVYRLARIETTGS